MTEPTAKPIDHAAERCGHNYPPRECPHERCGYREAMARIAELDDENGRRLGQVDFLLKDQDNYQAEIAYLKARVAELEAEVERLRKVSSELCDKIERLENAPVEDVMEEIAVAIRALPLDVLPVDSPPSSDERGE